MGYLFLIIMFAGLIAGIAIWVYFLRAYRKDKKKNKLSSKELKMLLIGWICFGVAGVAFPLAVGYLSNWNFSAGKMIMACISSFLFFSAFSLLWGCFYLYFYCPKTIDKQKKLFKIAMITSIFISVIGALWNLESVAEYLSYPLASGFSINGNGIQLFTPQNQHDGTHSGGLAISWYGVIIVFAAICAYWISDHRMYKKYGRHGILESTFLIAFPAGILGARIWYVVGNWERDGFNTNFWKVFEIWNGGLTILGGAVAGILAGALWVIFRRKYVDLRFAIDMVIPCILLSQAIGRWGNFFNLEVYGNVVSTSGGWAWVPSWIQQQMGFFASAKDIPQGLDPSLYSGLQLASGYMNAPLFLVESLFNIGGFLIISYVVPLLWKKHRAPGVNLGLYLLWYGIVRIIMEPMRNTNFMMGNTNNWSIINAGIYIGLGVLFIAGFEAFYFYRLKKGLSFEIVRGKMPKKKGTPKKKSSLAVVAEAQANANHDSRPIENEPDNEEKPAEPTPSEIEEDE